MNCENCGAPMRLERERDYKSVLIKQSAFALAVEYLRKHSAVQSLPQPLIREELERSLQCPRRGRKMDTHQYGGSANVVIDNCYDCQIIWLDWGELNKIITVPAEERLENDDGGV